jgi:polygalacturonase
MNMTILLILAALSLMTRSSYAADGEPVSTVMLPTAGATYDIRAFGVVGGGKTLDSKAIQSGIDQCTGAGGGTVLVAGSYVTGTLYLKSNVCLRVDVSAPRSPTLPRRITGRTRADRRRGERLESRESDKGR